MNPNGNTLSDEGRRFLQQQAKQLANTNSPAVLETSTAHSRYVGRVIEAEPGGLVFQEEITGNQVCIPWESVAYVTSVPQQRGAAATAR